MRRLLCFAVLAWAFPAVADLYRWVDPETGSVKFSSYPPPWYGNETQRRAPKVELIPARSGAGARPDPGPGNAPEGSATGDARGTLAALELERKALLQQIAGHAARPTPERAQTLQKQLQEFAALTDRLNKVNPEGTEARRIEAEQLLQKLIQGEKR